MSDLTVDEGRFVLMTYELSVDGERLEQRTKDYPLGVVIGKHKLLPKFEEAIRGLKAGDLFYVILPPEDALGPYREELILNVPHESFMVDGKLDEQIIQTGKRIPLEMPDGTEAIGEVMFNNGFELKMDFNPPLAGKTLAITGKILHIEDCPVSEVDRCSD